MKRQQTESLFGPESSEPKQPCSNIVRVAFASGADAEFDYFVPDDLWPVSVGQRVEIPFGRSNRLETAFCTQSPVDRADSFIAAGSGRRLKRVKRVIDDEPLLDEHLMGLARWISEYYVCPLGQVLAAMVPAAVKKGAGLKTLRQIYLGVGEDEIEAAIDGLRGRKQKAILEHLRERNAWIRDQAVDLQHVLDAAGSTESPVKKLLEQQLVRMTTRTVLASLPAVPEGLRIAGGPVELNEDQNRALTRIGARLESGGFGVTVLHGVTDSGKTEVYIRAIEKALAGGRGAIVLLPEIALTAQTVQRFNERFEQIAVMHSQLTATQRNAQWQKIKAGRAKVVIGARSAVFAPLQDCGLIVVDEEHEPSYKQDTAPRYNGRDVAIKRAQLAGAHCVLGSATPSMESLVNCKRRQSFELVRLPKRVMDLPMPEMHLVDMKDESKGRSGVRLVSETLQKNLVEALERGEQAILLLNRRGYSNFVFCPSCKHTLHCRNCDVTLTFHKKKNVVSGSMQTVTGTHMHYGYAMCHYCLAQTLVPEKCPLCGSGLTMIGLGSQRLEEELASKFPQARVRRIDSDSMAGGDYYRLLEDFGQGRIDILAGTQMLAKGLHFPNVTVVGIISADTCLYLPDFRTNERTYQLIRQVSGRAGRSQKRGKVFVQTFLPDQPAIQYAMKGDFRGFAADELKHRKSCNLPPFGRLALVVLKDENSERLEQACSQMRQRVDSIITCDGLRAAVRGPMPATIARIQQFHRMQIIVQAPDANTMLRLFGRLRAVGPVKPAVKVAIDIDPVNLL